MRTVIILIHHPEMFPKISLIIDPDCKVWFDMVVLIPIKQFFLILIINSSMIK